MVLFTYVEKGEVPMMDNKIQMPDAYCKAKRIARLLISVIIMSVSLPAASTAFESADIVIIGAGASGMSAALAAAESGAKRVLVLEKMPFVGGTSNFAEGIFAVESDMQKKESIRITRDEAFHIIMDYSHWRANPDLVRAFIDKSPNTITWLQNMGVKFIKPFAMWPNSPRTWHLLDGYGASMMRVLFDNAQRKGVEIATATVAKKIIRRPNGPVTGVVIERSGTPATEIKTKAVVIATGGYANNKEWIKKYTGYDLGVNIFPIGNRGKMGEGIQMAWDVGAAQEGMGVLQFVEGGPGGPGVKMRSHINGAVPQPQFLWINKDGKRFADEGIGHNFTFHGNAHARQTDGIVFRIFDENIKKYMVEEGIDHGMGVQIPVGTKLVDLDADIKAAVAAGNPNIFVAQSLEELAAQMKVDPAVFKQTIAQYNSFCVNKHDDKYAKDPRYLIPIRTPKFYAFKCYPAFLGTIGGVKVNEKLEALDKENKSIPGLYVVGSDAGGMYGDSYDLFSAGGTMGFAVNSGRIAGENAAIFCNK